MEHCDIDCRSFLGTTKYVQQNMCNKNSMCFRNFWIGWYSKRFSLVWYCIWFPCWNANVETTVAINQWQIYFHVSSNKFNKQEFKVCFPICCSQSLLSPQKLWNLPFSSILEFSCLLTKIFLSSVNSLLINWDFSSNNKATRSVGVWSTEQMAIL